MQLQALQWREAGGRIGFVPTMGCLHEGHLSLIRRAKKIAGTVVLSIYVNPSQFGPKEDFAKYPRPFHDDRRLAEKAGADFLFAPGNLYEQDDSTVVSENFFSRGRCAASRPTHFDGVTTVVAKLFLIVQPHFAIFGQKDAQQCDVIERMIRDLRFPVRMVRSPIVRDKRGLALSSRNRYLSPQEYDTALHFPKILAAAARLPHQSAEDRVLWAKKNLGQIAGLSVDYVEVAGNRLCGAVRVGQTRILDNFRCA